jgi:hypothetical protein
MVPGGNEVCPGRLYVTTERVIIESTAWLGLKKAYEDLHYMDIMSMNFKKNVFSSELIIKSRFQCDIHLKAVGTKEAQQMQRIISEGMNRYRYGYGGPRYNDSDRGEIERK